LEKTTVALCGTAKPHLEERLATFRDELKAHQEKVEKELQGQLDESRKQIVEYFVPPVVANPPDAMRGQFLKLEEAEARAWLDGELDRVFPKAEALIQKMQLDVRYKDVTFETLNREDVLDAVKEVFPRIDWDKAYKEFRAAGRRHDLRFWRAPIQRWVMSAVAVALVFPTGDRPGYVNACIVKVRKQIDATVLFFCGPWRISRCNNLAALTRHAPNISVRLHRVQVFAGYNLTKDAPQLTVDHRSTIRL
jgi:hypothetical protein